LLIKNMQRQEVKEYIKLIAKDTINPEIINAKLSDKIVLLDNVKEISKTENKIKKSKSKRKSMGVKERKERGFYDIESDSIIYDTFLPLHELWKQYINDLIMEGGPAIVKSRLLKADFHGSIIYVSRSKCPSLIGISGIVLLETANTFKIVTKQNILKVIPKANTIFILQAGNNEVTLYGNHFCYRAADRAARKFKSKPTLEL